MEIIKSDGTQVPFEPEKLAASLTRARVKEPLLTEAVQHVERLVRQGTSTQHMHAYLLQFLEQRDVPAAARYNLKHAMFQLGPTGFPFERYLSRVLQAYGWSTQVGVRVQGRCIQHEVDVLAKKAGEPDRAIEAKYHHQASGRTDVKVALYIHARHEDLRAAHPDMLGALVTNTSFTADARAYGECMGMRLKAWNYPEQKGLAHDIEAKRLYPITVFSQIPRHVLERCFEQDMLLAQELCGMNEQTAARVGLGATHLRTLQLHAQELCFSESHTHSS